MSEKGLAKNHLKWIKELLKLSDMELTELHEFLFLEGWKHGIKHYKEEQLRG